MKTAEGLKNYNHPIFKEGDKIKCIDINIAPRGLYPAPYELGKIYTSMGMDEQCKERYWPYPMVFLKEFPYDDTKYCTSYSYRFELVYSPTLIDKRTLKDKIISVFKRKELKRSDGAT